MNRQQRRQAKKISRIKARPSHPFHTSTEGNDWCVKGLEYYNQGELELSVACYRRVTDSMPEYPLALSNLASLFNSLGRHEEAVVCCQDSLKARPDYLSAYVNMGDALLFLGRKEEAEATARNCVSLHNDSPEAHCILANILVSMGKMDEAESHYLKALNIQPDFVKALIGLGNVMTETARLDEAALIYRTALTLKPDAASALNNLGNVLTSLGRLHEAKEVILSALSYTPNDMQARLNLGLLYLTLGEIEASVACYRKALEYKPDYVDIIHNLLFTQNYLGDESLETAIDDAKGYGRLVSAAITPFRHHPDRKDIHRRLRIGLVSGDLLKHPVGFFLDGVIPSLDPAQVELFVYSNYFQEDELTWQLKAVVPHWLMVMGMTDEALAERIRADNIDILMDLSGHTARNRLAMFAWKPAPVQVTWLGYFATTGLPAMDYILGDPFNLPPEEAHHFTETPWPLPDCYLCFTPPDLPLTPNPLPARSNGWVTFGCFNNTNKINNEVLTCWARILHAVPDSRLSLKSVNFSDPIMRQNLLDPFAYHGIGPERLILEGASARDLYFESYHRVDIALDPFPYPGVTTSVEGLWMGVPFITLRGHRYISHQGESILSNAGLTDWIAYDVDDYVAKAVQFAHDLPRLAILRTGLRRRVLQTPLFDTARFANHLLRAWQEMWRIWCEQGP
ncbi:MAG: tetratricopeptide repeat protein [Magnetococcales bacterium]|nr:tetratricopeptide repeat protein [Magnetococcales bacterium]